ncbi:hypothetical protein H8E77_36055 [bacterium]|nr:hypothetical protein [bacterium]
MLRIPIQAFAKNKIFHSLGLDWQIQTVGFANPTGATGRIINLKTPKLIVATALYLGIPLITKDEQIREADIVNIIW